MVIGKHLNKLLHDTTLKKDLATGENVVRQLTQDYSQVNENLDSTLVKILEISYPNSRNCFSTTLAQDSGDNLFLDKIQELEEKYNPQLPAKKRR